MRKIITLFFMFLIFPQCSEHNNEPTEKEQSLAVKKFSITPHQINPDNRLKIDSKRKEVKNTGKKIPKIAKKIPEHLPVSIPPKNQQSGNDSLFFNKMQYLRREKIEIDINEPISREYLFSTIENGNFPSMITLSRERFLQINFDNDILDNTDRFFTNGIRFDFISPLMQQYPLSRLMVPYWGKGMNYYGISLVQDMYTPSTTKLGGILYGDRPYAAYLFVGNFKITNDELKKFRQTSELDLGIIGPYSMGDFVQKTFHNNVPTNSEPLGWEYQIKNDVVVNYNINLEKGVLSLRNFEGVINANGAIGTLYTNIGAGFMIRTGFFNPYFNNLGISRQLFSEGKSYRHTQLFLSLKTTGKMVGYDATLEGGVFNRNSAYMISSGSVSRLVFQSSASVKFTFGGFSYSIEQFVLSPEFHNGWWHKWVHMNLAFCL
ncbi:MAG: lipid A deacylase LpxR family protein [Bacteroidetes bacterium]|nr:lipid A deacylase LpxR family protein [Bacteroidota bacterium]